MNNYLEKLTEKFPKIFTRYKDVITSVFSFLRLIPANSECGRVGVKAHTVAKFNPIQYGLFQKHYGIMPRLVTLMLLKVEGQKLLTWSILMCFLQKWY